MVGVEVQATVLMDELVAAVGGETVGVVAVGAADSARAVRPEPEPGAEAKAAEEEIKVYGDYECGDGCGARALLQN